MRTDICHQQQKNRFVLNIWTQPTVSPSKETQSTKNKSSTQNRYWSKNKSSTKNWYWSKNKSSTKNIYWYMVDQSVSPILVSVRKNKSSKNRIQKQYLHFYCMYFCCCFIFVLNNQYIRNLFSKAKNKEKWPFLVNLNEFLIILLQ